MSEKKLSVGDSTVDRKVWYTIEIINSPETNKESVFNKNVSIIYYDMDNKIINYFDNESCYMVSYILDKQSMVIIEKFEQLTKTTVVGFETATTEELSKPDFEPKPIYETVVEDPTKVVFNPFVNDIDGYRVVRDTRNRL